VDESQLNKTIIPRSNAKRRILKERLRFMEMLPKARLMEAWRFKDKKTCRNIFEPCVQCLTVNGRSV